MADGQICAIDMGVLHFNAPPIRINFTSLETIVLPDAENRTIVLHSSEHNTEV